MSARSRNRWAILGAATTIALLTYALLERRSTEQIKSQISHLQQEQQRLGAALRAADRASEENRQAREQLQRRSELLNTGNLPNRSSLSFAEALDRSPELLRLREESLRAGFRSQYGNLFARLKLTSEQIDALEQIEVENNAHWMDLDLARSQNGLDYDSTAMKAATEAAQRERHKKEATIVGEAALQQIEEFRRSEPARHVIDAFAATVAFSQPLTSGQKAELTRTLMLASPSYVSGTWMDCADVDWEAVNRAAQKILSPDQFTTWKTQDSVYPFQSHLGHEVDAAVRAAIAADRAKEQMVR